MTADDTYVVTAQAVDAAGNLATEAAVFAIDRTPPEILLLGVPDGACSAADVSPFLLVSDLNPGTEEAWLDGAPYAVGAAVTDEGWHLLAVHAVDAAGNAADRTVSFCVDKTPPVLAIAGVTDGETATAPVTPTWVAADANLVLVLATLDGAPFASGTTVSAEGGHLLQVVALDAAGLKSERTVAFAIRTLRPTVSVAPPDGSYHRTDVQPAWTVTGADAVLATLDGAPIAAGTIVSAEGRHDLAVTASSAGGSASASSTFFIDRTPPVVALAGVAEGAVVKGPAVVAATATDTYLAWSQVTLDGAPYAGQPIAAEGLHRVEVSAQDLAGNPASASLRFTVDATPPSITITGVQDGDLLGAPVLPVVTVTDPSLANQAAALDGASWLAGQVVSSEGHHRLEVTAADAAGNPAFAAVDFELDLSAPVIQVAGVVDGATVNHPVSPTFTAADAHLASTTAALDGQPFASGATVATAGAHTLTVVAVDTLGHRAERSVRFTVTLDKPVVSLAPPDGSYLPGDMVPTWTVTSPDPAVVVATADGAPIAPGTVVSAEGPHRLAVTATNGAGTTSVRTAFTIDRTPPKIELTGVADGDLVSSPVLPQVTVTDLYLASEETTLDGGPWLPGQVVRADGTHLLAVHATDLAGNPASVAIHFELDLTPPAISASVVDGATYPAPLTVTFSASDRNAGTVGATLDGAPLASGATITAAGDHRLVVLAKDRAGNAATREFAFAVTAAPAHRYVVTHEVAARDARVLAIALGQHLADADARRATDFLAAALPPGTSIELVDDGAGFLAALRSGRSNVVVLLEPWDDVAGCGRHVTLDAGAEAELTEAVYRGTGLVIAKALPEEWPGLREAAGVQWRGSVGDGQVQLAASALGHASTFWVPGGVELVATTASVVGTYGSAAGGCSGSGAAVTLHGFGLGAAVTLGFDPATAGTAAASRALLAGAVAYVTPEAALEPRGVVEVQVRVESQGAPATTRVRASLGAGLGVAGILDGGAALDLTRIEWHDAQEAGEASLFRYLVRLPSTPGSYQSLAEVAELTGAGPVVAGIWPLSLEVAQGEAELLASARSLAAALSTKGSMGAARRSILAALDRVEARHGTSATDREASVADLLGAAATAADLPGGEPNALRLALDRALGAWEARP